MVQLKSTIIPRNRGVIDVAHVWGVYDTRYSEQQAICEAYMTEWGIPLSNLVGISGGGYSVSSVWSSQLSIVAAAVPDSCQGIFCCPSMALQTGGKAFSRMLGHVKILEKAIQDAGASELDEVMLNALRDALRFEPDGTNTGTAAFDPDTQWNFKNYPGWEPITSNYVGTKDYADEPPSPANSLYPPFALNTDYLPPSLELSVEQLIEFVSYKKTSENYPTPGPDENNQVPLVHQILQQRNYIADFTIRKTLHTEKPWDIIPSWRLGWSDSRSWHELSGGPTPFTAADATALAQRSKATRFGIPQRQELSSVIGINPTRVPTSPGWNTHGQFLIFDALLRDLGFNQEKIKLGNKFADDPDLDGANPRSIPAQTGVSRYDLANFDYKYNSSRPGHVEAINGNTLPFIVDNFFYDGLNRNTGRTTKMPTPTYFEEGHPDQVYSIRNGAVGFSTPSYSLAQGGWFIKGGGCAYHGSYLEPYADKSSSAANTFFFNLLRGHQAATASLMNSGILLSEEELLGDGLAQPFALQNSGIAPRNPYSPAPDVSKSTNAFYCDNDLRVFLKNSSGQVWRIPTTSAPTATQQAAVASFPTSTLPYGGDSTTQVNRHTRSKRVSKAPAEWSFTTHIQPYNYNSLENGVDSVLWELLLNGTSTVDDSAVEQTSEHLKTTPTSNEVLEGFELLYLYPNSEGFRVSGCHVASANISIDLKTVASTEWSGLGTSLDTYEDSTDLYNSTSLQNYQGLVQSNYIVNKLSTVEFLALGNPVVSSNIVISRDLQPTSFELMNIESKPVGFSSSTLRVQGSLQMYIDGENRQNVMGALRYLLEQENSGTPEILINIGGVAPNTSRLEVHVGQSTLSAPELALEGLGIVNINFEAYPYIQDFSSPEEVKPPISISYKSNSVA